MDLNLCLGMKLIEIRDQHIECESPSPGNRDP